MDTVLDAAMETFWYHGYDGTSMETLLEATGLHKGSLYKAFSDKRAVYIATLQRYMQLVLDGWRQTATSSPSPGAAIQRWFHGLATFKGAMKGCFVANASVEVAPHDPEIARMLRNFTTTLRAAFASTIEQGKATGEFNPDVDTQSIAELLVIAMFGMRVVGKHSKHSLGVVEVIMRTLRPDAPEGRNAGASRL